MLPYQAKYSKIKQGFGKKERVAPRREGQQAKGETRLRNTEAKYALLSGYFSGRRGSRGLFLEFYAGYRFMEVLIIGGKKKMS